MLDPRRCNISPDANALDHNGSPRDALFERFEALAMAKTLAVVITGSVGKEVQHSRTPASAQDAILPRIFKLQPELIAV